MAHDVFGKAKKKHRKVARPERYQHPVAASFSLPLSGNTLLDEAAGQIGIDQPLCRIGYGFGQIFVADPFSIRISCKASRFVDRHGSSLASYNDYSHYDGALEAKSAHDYC